MPAMVMNSGWAEYLTKNLFLEFEVDRGGTPNLGPLAEC
jgi:hypothetical protein